MRWLSWTAWVVLVAGAVACSAPTNGGGPGHHLAPRRPHVAAGQGNGPSTGEVTSRPADRPFQINAQNLTPVIADRVNASEGQVLRAQNGFTLMVIATGW